MLHACNDCPGKEHLKWFLTDFFEDSNKEYINVNQWKK